MLVGAELPLEWVARRRLEPNDEAAEGREEGGVGGGFSSSPCQNHLREISGALLVPSFF